MRVSIVQPPGVSCVVRFARTKHCAVTGSQRTTVRVLAHTQKANHESGSSPAANSEQEITQSVEAEKNVHSPTHDACGHDHEEHSHDDHSHAHDAKGQKSLKLEEAFGPRGMLLSGFKEEEVASIQAWTNQMETGFKINCATDGAMSLTVQEAMFNKDQSQVLAEPWQQLDTISPRVCVMSGMTGEEQIAVIECWEHFSGTPTPIFSSVVRRVMDLQLRDLLQELTVEMIRYDEQNGEQTLESDQAYDGSALRRKLKEKAQGPLSSEGEASTMDPEEMKARLTANIEAKLRAEGNGGSIISLTTPQDMAKSKKASKKRVRPVRSKAKGFGPSPELD